MPKKEDLIFDKWLSINLKKLWDDALKEPIPQSILDILNGEKKFCSL